MSKKTKSTTKTPTTVEPEAFQSIDSNELANVAGGAARVTARGGTDPQLTQMLQSIGDSIKGLANQKPDDGGMSQMMMMMMMMGGGGGGAPAPAPAAAPLPPVINVTNSSRGGCY